MAKALEKTDDWGEFENLGSQSVDSKGLPTQPFGPSGCGRMDKSSHRPTNYSLFDVHTNKFPLKLAKDKIAIEVSSPTEDLVENNLQTILQQYLTDYLIQYRDMIQSQTGKDLSAIDLHISRNKVFF